MRDRILFVHPDERILNQTRRVLSGMGYAVTPATSGRRALAKAIGLDFDLILVNRALSDCCDGVWLVDRLRQYGVRTFVAAISSKAAWENQFGSAVENVDHFLPPRFTLCDLVVLVETVLHRPAPPQPAKPAQAFQTGPIQAQPSPSPPSFARVHPSGFEKASPPSKRILRHSPAPKRILLADTSREDRDRVTHSLADAGYDVAAFKTGREAYKAALNDPFELILTDLWLAEMDGFELIESLRHSGITAPIAVLTAHITRQMVDELRQWRVCKILLKPIPPSKLLSFTRICIR